MMRLSNFFSGTAVRTALSKNGAAPTAEPNGETQTTKITNKANGYRKGGTKMKQTQQLYEGKAKKVYATDVEGIYIVDYKDDATAFNGEKKGTIAGKGVINNRVTNYLMKMLEEKGIPTHFVEQLSDRETAVKAVRIVPLEVIVRNVAAGSLAKRIGFPEGTKLKSTVLELCYKDDALGDPMINDSHVFAMGLCTPEELETIKKYALKINEILTAFFAEVNIELIDFKLEFGRLSDGTIVLADEISPDTCRFWDSKTHEKLDKDRFRRDLGNVEGAYHEILHRQGNSSFNGVSSSNSQRHTFTFFSYTDNHKVTSLTRLGN